MKRGQLPLMLGLGFFDGHLSENSGQPLPVPSLWPLSLSYIPGQDSLPLMPSLGPPDGNYNVN